MENIPLARRQFPVVINRQKADIHSPPKSIAFFDLDRTLLKGSSIAAGLRHLQRERRFIREEIFSLILATGLISFFLERSPFLLKPLHLLVLPFNFMTMQRICSGWFWDCLIASISPSAVQKIREHKEQGDMVMVLSASTQFVAGFIAEYLDVLYQCTVLRIVDDHVTGEAIGEICYGSEKLHRAEAIARSWNVPLEKCTFYSDSYSDRSLLESVGHPIAVNPDWRLYLLARHRGWDVIQF